VGISVGVGGRGVFVGGSGLGVGGSAVLVAGIGIVRVGSGEAGALPHPLTTIIASKVSNSHMTFIILGYIFVITSSPELFIIRQPVAKGDSVQINVRRLDSSPLPDSPPDLCFYPGIVTIVAAWFVRTGKVNRDQPIPIIKRYVVHAQI